MKKKINLLWAVLCFCLQPALAQLDSIKPLKIGDKVPDMVFEKILNHKLSSAKLSDLYKGKLLILDMWNIFCSSCIAEMPRMEALHKKFEDQITILPVCLDYSDVNNFELSTEKFFAKRMAKGQKNWSTIVALSKQTDLFKKLFNLESVPAEIWIDSKGGFRGKTRSDVVNENTITKVLSSGFNDFDKFIDKRKSFDPTKPFLLPYQPNGKTSVYGSILTGFQDTIGISNFPDRQYDPNVRRVCKPNCDVFDLYLWNQKYNKFINYEARKRVIVEKSPLPFYLKTREMGSITGIDVLNAQKENLFCYEIIMPPSYSLEEVDQQMINDFDKYFQIKSSIEKRKVKCMAIVPKGRLNLKNSGKNIPITEKSVDNDYYGINSEILTAHINTMLESVIVFDEMNYKEKFDFSLRPGKWNDVEAVRRELNRQGLDLIEKGYELDMLILKDQRK